MTAGRRLLRWVAGWVRRAPVLAIAVIASPSCSGGAAPTGDGAVAEKRCGESPETYFSAYSADQLAQLSDCTVLVGHFQEDSVTELEDFSALKNVRRIEGFLNVFRSPGFLTLHGLENLETVDGSVAIHANPNLMSIAALGNLRTVTRDLWITGNDRLPQAEVESIGAGIAVGGMKQLQSTPP
jgi:receptor L domain-containing protein